MSVAFGPYDASCVLDVILNMRPADRREVYATRQGEDPWALFADVHAAQAASLWFEVLYDGDLMGLPVGFYGVNLRSPGVGSAYMIATAALRPMQARALARRVRGATIPALVAQGLRRVDCESMEGHAAAHAFLRWAGARGAPQPRRAIGKRGEDFREFAWLAAELGGNA